MEADAESPREAEAEAEAPADAVAEELARPGRGAREEAPAAPLLARPGRGAREEAPAAPLLARPGRGAKVPLAPGAAIEVTRVLLAGTTVFSDAIAFVRIQFHNRAKIFF